MSDKGSLEEKAGIVVFARVLTTVIDLALAITTIQLLIKQDFAIMGYILMIHELARNLATLGLPESIFYFFERITYRQKARFVGQTVAMLSIAGLAAAGLILGVSSVLPSILTEWSPEAIDQLQNVLPWLALVVLLEIPTWPVSNILLALDRQKDAAWYETLTSAILFVAIVIPIVLGFGVLGAVYGMVGYAALRALGSAIWVTARLIQPHSSGGDDSHIQELENGKPEPISLMEQLRFSLPLGLSSYVNKLNRNIDKVVVSVLLPVVALADYTLGAQEVPIIRVIPFAIGSVLISRFVAFQLDGKKQELLELWYRGVEKVSLLVLPLGVLSIVIAPDLIAWIASSDQADYSGAVLPFQIYNAIVLLRVTHYGSLLQAFGDSRGVLRMSLQLVALNLVLSIPATLAFGIVGTAASTLLANIVNWWLYLRRIGRHLDLPAHKVLPFRRYTSILGISLGIGSVMMAIQQWGFPGMQAPARLLTIAALFLPTYWAVGSWTRVIKQDDRAQFRRWISLTFFRSS
jgi:O-antigen/teichoic acid export membrane protein